MSWILKRVGTSIFMIWLVTTIIFFLIRLMPGNPMDYMLMQLISMRSMSVEEATRLVQSYFGFNPNEPLSVQYINYFKGLLSGNLGQSILFPGTPVGQLLGQSVPWTAFIVGVSLLISFMLGISLGTSIAYARGTRLDNILSLLGSITNSIPNYIVAILLVYIFGGLLHLFPMRGAYGTDVTPGFNLRFILNVIYHGILPIASYVITSFGGWMLSMKGSTTSVLGEDYIMAAKAKGIPARKIKSSYVRRNAILPLFTNLTLSIGFMLGGALFIETTFSYPGVGYYLSTSVSGRDYPLMQGCFLLITVAVILANLVTDLTYSRLDPRIKVR